MAAGRATSKLNGFERPLFKILILLTTLSGRSQSATFELFRDPNRTLDSSVAALSDHAVTACGLFGVGKLFTNLENYFGLS